MRWLLLIGLLARTALADAPHGEYVLAVSDQPKWTLFVPKDHQLSPCGARTDAVWSKLQRFAVRFRQARRPHAPDEVLIDNEPWDFTGYASDGSAAAERTKDSIVAVLWFRRDSDGHGQGSISVVLFDAGKAVCGDILALHGSYTWRP